LSAQSLVSARTAVHTRPRPEQSGWGPFASVRGPALDAVIASPSRRCGLSGLPAPAQPPPMSPPPWPSRFHCAARCSSARPSRSRRNGTVAGTEPTNRDRRRSQVTFKRGHATACGAGPASARAANPMPSATRRLGHLVRELSTNDKVEHEAESKGFATKGDAWLSRCGRRSARSSPYAACGCVRHRRGPKEYGLHPSIRCLQSYVVTQIHAKSITSWRSQRLSRHEPAFQLPEFFHAAPLTAVRAERTAG